MICACGQACKPDATKTGFRPARGADGAAQQRHRRRGQAAACQGGLPPIVELCMDACNRTACVTGTALRAALSGRTRAFFTCLTVCARNDFSNELTSALIVGLADGGKRRIPGKPSRKAQCSLPRTRFNREVQGHRKA